MIEENNLFDTIVSLIEGDNDCERKPIKIPFIRDYNMYSVERIVYIKRYQTSTIDAELSFMFPNPDTIVSRVVIKKAKWQSIIWPSITNQWYTEDISVDFVARRNEKEGMELQNIAHVLNAFFNYIDIAFLYNIVIKQQTKNILISKLPPVFSN